MTAKESNFGFVSGTLAEKPKVKNLESGMSMARVVIDHASEFDGKRRDAKLELTAWGAAASDAEALDVGDRVMIQYRIGSRPSKPHNDGTVYHNLTASIQSIVAVKGAPAGAASATKKSESAPVDDSVPF